MNKKAIKAEIENLKSKIKELDEKLDNESAEGIDEMEAEIRKLYASLAQAERVQRFLNLKEAKPSEWEETFLKSFPLGTRVISKKQAVIFEKIAKGTREFRFGNMHYSFRSGCVPMVVVEKFL